MLKIAVVDNITAMLGIPQHPVAEHETIEVKYAKDGSGIITFDYDGDPRVALR